MKKVVLHNQSLADFTLHHCGTLNVLFDVAIANGLSIDEIPIPGTELIIPDTIIKNNEILDFYESKSAQPAFGYKNPNDTDGIGTMVIGNDFIVA